MTDPHTPTSDEWADLGRPYYCVICGKAWASPSAADWCCRDEMDCNLEDTLGGDLRRTCPLKGI